MKMLCCDKDIRVCNELRELLESHGIPCLIQNETQEPVLGGDTSPLANTTPQLWVVEDSDFERALQIIHPDKTPDPQEADSEGE